MSAMDLAEFSYLNSRSRNAGFPAPPRTNPSVLC